MKNKKDKPAQQTVSNTGKQADAIVIRRSLDDSDFLLKIVDFENRTRKPKKKKTAAGTQPGKGIVLNADPAKQNTPGGNDLSFTADDGKKNHTVSDGGGKKITNVNIHLLFWGSQWLKASNSPSAGSVVNAVDSILSGPYFNGLSQYGVGSGQVADAFIITSPNPNNPFSDGDVSDMVWNLIDAGFFPEPDDAGGRNEFFAFIMPPGVNTSDTGGVIGNHYMAHDYDFPFDWDTAWCCWVMNNGTLDFVTKIFSHELVEACTDPEGDAIQVNPRNSSSWNEIGDICQNSSGFVNGVFVQSYWSQKDKACIIPTNPSNPIPAGSKRKITVNSHFHILDPGVFSDDSGNFNISKSIIVDPNHTTGQIVITSPVVGGESSADLILNITWKPDFSVAISFTSTLYDGSDVDSSTGNSFNLPKNTWQGWWVNHQSGDWIYADTCHIDFDVHNDPA